MDTHRGTGTWIQVGVRAHGYRSGYGHMDTGRGTGTWIQIEVRAHGYRSGYGHMDTDRGTGAWFPLYIHLKVLFVNCCCAVFFSAFTVTF